MSQRTEAAYFEARQGLNSAVEAFIEAAYAIDKDARAIARDICDSVYDASNGEITPLGEI